MPRRRKPTARLSIAAAVLAAIVVFAAGVWFGGRRPADPAAASRRAMATRSPTARKDARAAAPATPSPSSEAPSKSISTVEKHGRIALVIDDLGRSFEELDALAALGVPLSYAVLPYETLTPRIVERLRERGAEILCHLPMEATGGANPGWGAVGARMSAKDVARATEWALDAVPGAVGVNNHMGSKITADPDAMRAILGVVRARNLFFLDSRTTPSSVGFRMARETGIPAAERQVFLDGDPAEAAIRAEFERLRHEADERGAAIAIGHPRPATLAVLATEVPRARADGYGFVTVSSLLTRGEMPPSERR